MRRASMALLLASCSGGADTAVPPPPADSATVAIAAAAQPARSDGPCVLPEGALHGAFVLQGSDVVVSTSAGDLRVIPVAAVTTEAGEIVASGAAAWPWFVLRRYAASAEERARVAAELEAAGFGDVRVCEADGALWLMDDGSVRNVPLGHGDGAPGTGVSLEGPGTPPHGGYGSGGGCCDDSHRAFGRVHVREITSHGAISVEIVRRVARRNLNQLRFCFDQAIPEAPELAGRVELSWRIDANGAVAEAAVSSSTLGRSDVEACMVRALSAWTFPAPTDGAPVPVSLALELEVEG